MFLRDLCPPDPHRVSVFGKIRIFSFQSFDIDSFMNVSMLSNQVFDLNRLQIFSKTTYRVTSDIKCLISNIHM